ncbi:hypothetical protein [Yersinia phage fHe-Yen9-04]|uniref:Uncharacterized protein n=2 Tax=Eneladusvirus Yen904 TaxID=2560849 RepID=A0A2C9CYH4_9CAUD|nr:hypothetical protein FDJ41_gp111 [Yersinia phage fHe-Yen9-04]SOK58388.1 hypothetical protein [Yersinia phage fHe-Yen9-04]SOK58923.1 hypothetical protein [Yersinia phage fHe-Yen9-03]VUE36157.1 hypothetical protein [Yersinia phage fHe-Yen9-04]
MINENNEQIDVELENHNMIEEIYTYFSNIGTPDVIIYGSFIEKTCGFDVIPNDIDISVIIKDELPENHYSTFFLNSSKLPINVEYLSMESFKQELNSFQPKYFLCTATPELSELIDSVWKNKELHEIRAGISSITSKAFDKGRKKLLVHEDYDEVLGLKNLYHAFKFPLYAKWYYYPELACECYLDDIEYLNDIHKNIYEIYKNSNGTLDERCDIVVSYAKPLYNKLLTDFRKLFPKKV